MLVRPAAKRPLRGGFLLLNHRCMATRNEFDSPFEHIRQRKHYFSWKASGIFLVIGAYMAYNETLFDYYALFTDSAEKLTSSVLKLEYALKNLPIYERLAHPKPGDRWVKLHSWENLDRTLLETRDHTEAKRTELQYENPSVHSHILAKPGGIMLQPVIFHNLDTDKCVTILHAGYRLCGFPFMIHGGIIATFLNESFKRAASLSKSTTSDLKGDFKVEELNINYKSPTFANQFLILETSFDDTVTDPKVSHLTSKILSESGKLLVTSTATLRNTGAASLARQGSLFGWGRRE